MNAEPFCDYLDVTVPLVRGDDVLASLDPVLLEAGACVEGDTNDYARVYRVGDGVLVTKAVRDVLRLSASGAVLATLRATGLFANYLAVLGEGGHRVTRLDAALDVLADAAPVVLDVLHRGRHGSISLTRKRVPPRHVTFADSLALYCEHVQPTGTVYLGRRGNEASAKVYDKRNERMDRGLADPGPWLRYEVTVRSGLRPSLRDAWVPAELFYHLASPDLVPRPPGIADWVPRGEGFVLPQRTRLDPAAALKRRLDASLELEAWLELADKAGPHGREFLLTQLRRRIEARPLGHHAAAANLPTAALEPLTGT